MRWECIMLVHQKIPEMRKVKDKITASQEKWALKMRTAHRKEERDKCCRLKPKKQRTTKKNRFRKVIIGR